MRGRLVSCDENVLSLLRNTLVIPTLLILSGCGYAPDPLPGGAPGIIHYPGFRAIVGKLDLAVVVTVKHTPQNEKQDVGFYWAEKGALIWGERPGNTAAEWRFVLIAPGVKEPLCQTRWLMPDTTHATCNFEAENYVGIPLTGEIDYRLGGEQTGKDDAPYRIVTRVYYMVHEKKP